MGAMRIRVGDPLRHQKMTLADATPLSPALGIGAFT